MRVYFGPYVLDRGSRQLLREDDIVHLSPKAFDLLHFLIDHRPRVLSKHELHDRLWPSTFVSDASLASLVAEIREALGDSARRPRYVRTAHRVGYAFCGEAACVPEPEPSTTPVMYGLSTPISRAPGQCSRMARTAGVAITASPTQFGKNSAMFMIRPWSVVRGP